jgi:hypothetical protein
VAKADSPQTRNPLEEVINTFSGEGQPNCQRTGFPADFCFKFVMAELIGQRRADSTSAGGVCISVCGLPCPALP